MINPIVVDIIVLSYAKDQCLKQMTEQMIDSLLASEVEDKIRFNIIVIESNKSLAPFQFKHTQTLYPKEKFGFHKFLNIGIKASSSEFVCLCNNDLIFHKGWATAVLNAMEKDPSLMSASPYCPTFHGNRGIDKSENIYGYTNGIHVAGWCIFVKRALFEQIGLLDEKFIFWCCDDDYRMSLQQKNISHALVGDSVVEHLESVSIDIIASEQKRSFRTKLYTTAQQHYFDYKWKHKNLLLLYAKYFKLFLFDK